MQDTANKTNDFDMPEPKTKSYKQVVMPKQKFYDVLDDIIYHVPFNYVLNKKDEKRPEGEIKISMSAFDALVHKEDKMFDIPVINDIIAFVSSMPYGEAKKFMAYMQNAETQKPLWDVKVI